jgi:ABC-2 type transport system ATP-binding protein
VTLVIEHLSKTYANGTVALNDVSLTIPPGMFGLLGPNGAGKSTLMRILATLQDADAGSVRLDGIDVLRDHEAVRRTLGYLPQEFGLYPRVPAEEMLDHFALLKGIIDRGERRAVVQSLLQQTNLWGARRQRLGGFSGGMRQRFGIAVALLGNPRLIIVDEPTAGLDPAERARFLNLLSELGERAVVLLSTHIVEDVSDLCTRMAIIQGGRILLEGEPARAVDALRGRVWRRTVERAELPALERDLPVISTTLTGGRTVIHVAAAAPPTPSFEPVEPDLKDVYFTVIHGVAVAHPEPSPDDHDSVDAASVDGTSVDRDSADAASANPESGDQASVDRDSVDWDRERDSAERDSVDGRTRDSDDPTTDDAGSWTVATTNDARPPIASDASDASDRSQFDEDEFDRAAFEGGEDGARGGGAG